MSILAYRYESLPPAMPQCVRRFYGSLKGEPTLGGLRLRLGELDLEVGEFSSLIRYRYEDDGILPDGSRLPDIPVMNLLLIRRELGKALAGKAIMDTGFDESLYANAELIEFLEGSNVLRTATLLSVGHEVGCEVFGLECHLADENFRPAYKIGEVSVYAPVNVDDLSEDVIVGRSIINVLKLQLNGHFLEVLGQP